MLKRSSARTSRREHRSYEVLIGSNAQGELFVLLAPPLCNRLGLVAGQRLWFCLQGAHAWISTKPWGPYPTDRRTSSRIRRVRSKRAQFLQKRRHFHFCERKSS